MSRYLLASLLCLTLGAPLVAAAQSSTDAARALFREGVRESQAGRWARALELFQSSYALLESPTLLFNIASAQQRCDKLLASNATYRRFLASVETEKSAPQRREASLEIARIEKMLPRLRVHIDGLRAGDHVTLDRTRLFVEELDKEIWVDPGTHVVRVEREQGDQEAHSVEVVAGQTRVLSFRVP